MRQKKLLTFVGKGLGASGSPSVVKKQIKGFLSDPFPSPGLFHECLSLRAYKESQGRHHCPHFTYKGTEAQRSLMTTQLEGHMLWDSALVPC